MISIPTSYSRVSSSNVGQNVDYSYGFSAFHQTHQGDAAQYFKTHNGHIHAIYSHSDIQYYSYVTHTAESRYITKQSSILK
jgi:hypothetical protein